MDEGDGAPRAFFGGAAGRPASRSRNGGPGRECACCCGDAAAAALADADFDSANTTSGSDALAAPSGLEDHLNALLMGFQSPRGTGTDDGFSGCGAGLRTSGALEVIAGFGGRPASACGGGGGGQPRAPGVAPRAHQQGAEPQSTQRRRPMVASTSAPADGPSGRRCDAAPASRTTPVPNRGAGSPAGREGRAPGGELEGACGLSARAAAASAAAVRGAGVLSEVAEAVALLARRASAADGEAASVVAALAELREDAGLARAELGALRGMLRAVTDQAARMLLLARGTQVRQQSGGLALATCRALGAVPRGSAPHVVCTEQVITGMCARCLAPASICTRRPPCRPSATAPSAGARRKARSSRACGAPRSAAPRRRRSWPCCGAWPTAWPGSSGP
jgi:hypothetical protein